MGRINLRRQFDPSYTTTVDSTGVLEAPATVLCWLGTRGASGMELPDAASGPRHRTRVRAAGSLEKLDDRPVLKCQLHD